MFFCHIRLLTFLMIVNIEFKGDLTYAPQRCKVRVKDAIDFKIDLGLALGLGIVFGPELKFRI